MCNSSSETPRLNPLWSGWCWGAGQIRRAVDLSPPSRAALHVTVVVAPGRGDAHDNRRFSDVRAETGPERVVGPRLIDQARVEFKPVEKKLRETARMTATITIAPKSTETFLQLGIPSYTCSSSVSEPSAWATSAEVVPPPGSSTLLIVAHVRSPSTTESSLSPHS